MDIVVPDEFEYLYVRNAERPVVKIPDPVLRKVANPVNKFGPKIAQLADELVRLMKKSNGVGLAANQLGYLQRMCAIAPAGERASVLINPVIVKCEGEQLGEEGCLSIPGLYGDVKRFSYVEVEAYDKRGRLLVYELEGMPARIAQHEIDHLDGVLFIDKVDIATLHWVHPDVDRED